MDIANLVDFVKTGEVFDKIDWNFEQVVSDFDFWDLKWFLHINTFVDFNKVDKSKKTLFVLDKLLYENVVDFLDIKDFCILDMNFGISSIARKLSISNINPKDIIDQNIDIYEPLDLISFLHYLWKDGKNYIRINSFDTSSNFCYNNEVMDFIDLSNKWFDGDNFTIITTWSLLPEIIRTSHLLNENGIFVKVIVLNKINIEFSTLKLDSKNVIFVLDLI